MNTLLSLHKVEVDKNKERLLNIEKEIGFRVPSSFTNYLVKFNAARPKLTFFSKGNIEFNINYFFGFSENKHQDFLSNYKSYINRMPQEVFPIASVDGGDLLCMNKENGNIYYWFHEKDDRGLEGNESKPTKVANSLDELIETLSEAEGGPSKLEIEIAKKQAKITKITPEALRFINEARAEKGLPPVTMDDYQ